MLNWWQWTLIVIGGLALFRMGYLLIFKKKENMSYNSGIMGKLKNMGSDCCHRIKKAFGI